MCELLAISASAPVNVKLSLGELARHGGKTGIHSDGWGAAFLDGRDVRLFREPAASAFSPWVRCLQEHAIQSGTVIAHIRHATRGAVSLANTQPFVRELDGRAHVFAHNGHFGEAIPAEALSGQCYQPIGEMDSEAAFCLLMQRLAARRDQAANERSEGQLGIFSTLACEMRLHGPANIIHASDEGLLVHADRRRQSPGVIEPPGLWMLRRQCHPEPRSKIAGAGVIVEGTALDVILIASVPLTTEIWEPLERGTVLKLQNGRVFAQQVV
jgi:predicted glutamine amidotransferase